MSLTPQDMKNLSPDQRRALLKQLLAEKQQQSLPKSFPASLAQQRMWVLTRLNPDSAAYNLLNAYFLSGPLLAVALEHALAEIISRHEILRTVFSVKDGAPIQVVKDDISFSMGRLDFSDQPLEKRDALAHAEACRLCGVPFDLSVGPLFRASLLLLAPDRAVLVLVMHHIVSDNSSMAIINKELESLYSSFAAGKSSPLSPLSLQYKSLALSERSAKVVAENNRQLIYWQNKLAHIIPTEIRPDYPRPIVQTFHGSTHAFVLPACLRAPLNLLSKQSQTSLFMLLLAAFQILLRRHSGASDISVGTSIANRGDPSTRALIGFFINTLVLRNDLSGNPSVKSFLAQVRKSSVEAYSHASVPFDQVVQGVGVPRDPSRNPLYQVAFQLGTLPLLHLEGLETRLAFELDHGVVRSDLEFYLGDQGESLKGFLVFNRDLYKRASIEALALHFETLLSHFCAAPDCPIDNLSILSQQERVRILWLGNNSYADVPGNPGFHSVFFSRQKVCPDHMALVDDLCSFSYRDLWEKSAKLASWLKLHGVGRGTPVGVFLDRRAELVICFLGILQAGGIYVPLAPEYPQDRLDYMVDHCGMPLILTRAGLRANLPAGPAEIRVFEDFDPLHLDATPLMAVEPSDGAYLIYTSGSTGKPKGVLVSHAGLPNLNLAQTATFGLEPGERIQQLAAIGFDASIFELSMALLSGGTFFCPPADHSLLGRELAHLLVTREITNITLTPTLLASMPRKPIDSLKTIVVAGEAAQAGLLAFWSQNHHVYNAYGPTEATVWSSTEKCNEKVDDPCIGLPIANMNLFIVDSHLEHMPVGVAGQLAIAGSSLARGYFKRPDLTAAAFVPNPFGRDPGRCIYLSGDLAVKLASGKIRFLGRIDNQVKLRGFRIELSEIESHLRAFNAVSDAVVMVREDKAGDRRLTAYLIAPDEVVASDELKSYLAGTLPKYMVPSHFVGLQSFPFSPNGKLDFARLPVPDLELVASTHRQLALKEGFEKETALLWQEILNVSSVHPNDNFFSLGGNSLLLVQLQSRLSEKCDKDISVSEMFQFPTLKTMAEFLNRTTQSDADAQKGADRGSSRKNALRGRSQKRRSRSSK